MGATAATSAFATVVGLLSDFVSQRKQAKAEDYQEFLDWLSEHRHTEIVELLGQQSRTVTSIKALMAQDRQDLNGRLEGLDRVIAGFAGVIDELKPVAEALHPGSALSEQALDILRQFQKAGASKALSLSDFGGPSTIFIDGKQGNLVIPDERFRDDDLGTLVDLGLLRLEYNSNGRPMYIYTRRADEVIRVNLTSEA